MTRSLARTLTPTPTRTLTLTLTLTLALTLTRFWGYGSKTCGAAAAANLSGVLPKLSVDAGAARVMAAGSVCAGWSDLYHVPLRCALT